MQIESTITISVKDIKKWVSKSNSLHSLQSIRAKVNKRIKVITQRKEESPFKHIPIEEKRKVLESLFVKPEVDSSQPLDVKQEGGNGVPPTAKPVGIPPKLL